MMHELGHVQRINALAAEVGLTLRGWFNIKCDDQVPIMASGQSPQVLLLFGQTGSTVWHVFSSSPEYADGKANPMDRWSYRTGTAIAAQLDGMALFPFEGPPWHPFGQWAQRAEIIRPSPLGILMHPRYGLWHAYRFAIALPLPLDSVDGPDGRRHTSEATDHLCDSCIEQPCMTACPVGAFTKGAYDVLSCANYLRDNEQADCHLLGCRARGACPEAESYTYELAHRQFHMQQFYRSLERSGD